MVCPVRTATFSEGTALLGGWPRPASGGSAGGSGVLRRLSGQPHPLGGGRCPARGRSQHQDLGRGAGPRARRLVLLLRPAAPGGGIPPGLDGRLRACLPAVLPDRAARHVANGGVGPAGSPAGRMDPARPPQRPGRTLHPQGGRRLPLVADRHRGGLLRGHRAGLAGPVGSSCGDHDRLPARRLDDNAVLVPALRMPGGGPIALLLAAGFQEACLRIGARSSPLALTAAGLLLLARSPTTRRVGWPGQVATLPVRNCGPGRRLVGLHHIRRSDGSDPAERVDPQCRPGLPLIVDLGGESYHRGSPEWGSVSRARNRPWQAYALRHLRTGSYSISVPSPAARAIAGRWGPRTTVGPSWPERIAGWYGCRSLDRQGKDLCKRHRDRRSTRPAHGAGPSGC